MIQITYVSTAALSLDAEELFRIIEVSSRNNLRDDLTGFLVFSGGRFFQLLEGPEAAVENLLGRLAGDRRHTALTVLSREPVLARSFPRWHMKRLPAGDDLVQTVAAGTDGSPMSLDLRAALTAFANGAVTAA